MAKMGTMGKAPSLSGSPAMQAMRNGLNAKGMPMESPGKHKGLKGTPSSVSGNGRTKQPKGKAKPTFKAGNVKGVKRSAVSNLKRA